MNTRHDPDVKFTVRTLTRAKIAASLNALAEDREVNVKFSGDDPRLTDEVCAGFARGIGAAMLNGRVEEEIARVERECYGDLLDDLVWPSTS